MSLIGNSKSYHVELKVALVPLTVGGPRLDADSFKKSVSFFGLTLPSSAVYDILNDKSLTLEIHRL